MNNTSVEQSLIDCETELVGLLGIVTTIGFADPVVPFLNKYSIVKACGTIEVAFKAIIADHFHRLNDQRIDNYLDKKVRDTSTNPKYHAVKGILEHFDPIWGTTLHTKIEGLPHKTKIYQALSTLVETRNEFAHGGNPTMSLNETYNHFLSAREFIEILDQVVI